MGGAQFGGRCWLVSAPVFTRTASAGTDGVCSLLGQLVADGRRSGELSGQEDEAEDHEGVADCRGAEHVVVDRSSKRLAGCCGDRKSVV